MHCCVFLLHLCRYFNPEEHRIQFESGSSKGFLLVSGSQGVFLHYQLITTHFFFMVTSLCYHLQVSQYTFAMCSYREKKAEPVELLQLDGYTVDYTDPQPGTGSPTSPSQRFSVLCTAHFHNPQSQKKKATRRDHSFPGWKWLFFSVDGCKLQSL